MSLKNYNNNMPFEVNLTPKVGLKRSNLKIHKWLEHYIHPKKISFVLSDFMLLKTIAD